MSQVDDITALSLSSSSELFSQLLMLSISHNISIGSVIRLDYSATPTSSGQTRIPHSHKNL